jgi:hypothetical protein
MGRPRKEVDGNEVRRLATIGCTQVDIARYFGVDEKTIRNRFSDDYSLGREAGKLSLRRMQFKAAARGSVPMLIHLGKTVLGQTDRLDVTTGNQPVARWFERVHNPRDEGIPRPIEADEGPDVPG